MLWWADTPFNPTHLEGLAAGKSEALFGNFTPHVPHSASSADVKELQYGRV